MSPSGEKVKGYVYGGGMLLATQEVYLATNGAAVKWRHMNPGSASWVETTAARVFERQEMDPLGAEVGTFDPVLITPDRYGDMHADAPMFVDGGDPFPLSDGCGTVNGMPASCAEINERLANGTAVYEAWGGRSRAVPRQMAPSVTAPVGANDGLGLGGLPGGLHAAGGGCLLPLFLSNLASSKKTPKAAHHAPANTIADT